MSGSGSGRSRLLRRGPTASTFEVDDARGRRFEKRYDTLWPWTPLKGLLKGSMPGLSAAGEAANASALRALGVGAPRARALREAWRLAPSRLGLRRSGTVELAPVGGRPLTEVLEGAGERGPRAVARRRARRAVARALGALVARMHAAGRFHRDLYLCHVYWERERGEATLIDVARCTRRRWRRRRWAVKDLAALLLSSAGHATRGDRLTFLRAYLGDGVGPEELRRWARAAHRKALVLARHGRKG